MAISTVLCGKCGVSRLCAGSGETDGCPTCRALREQLVELGVAHALREQAGELPRFILPAGCPSALAEAIGAWSKALAEYRLRKWTFEQVKAARILEADARCLGGAEAFAILQADVSAANQLVDEACLEVERRGAWLVYLQQGG